MVLEEIHYELDNLFKKYVWVFCLYKCLFTTCMPSAYISQKRTPDPLELKLHTVMSHNAGDGT